MSRKEIAKNLFLSGYNCAQAVVLAFKDELNESEGTLLKVASSFGGGLGRLREVCGAVSGMAIVLGLKYGNPTRYFSKSKAEQYRRVQEVVLAFKDKNGSYICRELIGEKPNGFIPEERTEAYYKKRPCIELVGDAAEILDNYIKKQK